MHTPWYTSCTSPTFARTAAAQCGRCGRPFDISSWFPKVDEMDPPLVDVVSHSVESRAEGRGGSSHFFFHLRERHWSRHAAEEEHETSLPRELVAAGREAVRVLVQREQAVHDLVRLRFREAKEVDKLLGGIFAERYGRLVILRSRLEQIFLQGPENVFHAKREKGEGHEAEDIREAPTAVIARRIDKRIQVQKVFEAEVVVGARIKRFVLHCGVTRRGGVATGRGGATEKGLREVICDVLPVLARRSETAFVRRESALLPATRPEVGVPLEQVADLGDEGHLV
jgi:hypothetical protein